MTRRFLKPGFLDYVFVCGNMHSMPRCDGFVLALPCSGVVARAVRVLWQPSPGTDVTRPGTSHYLEVPIPTVSIDVS